MSREATDPTEVILKVYGKPCEHGFTNINACRICKRAYGRAWYARNADRCRQTKAVNAKIRRMNSEELRQSTRASSAKSYFMRKHGVTLEERKRMHDAQGGLCAICAKPESAVMRGKIQFLAIDHDHSKGSGRASIRGLLCISCNCALRRIEDDPGWAEKAAAYLARFKKGDAP